jgi:autotransporter-associated beta strand protein
MKRAVIGGCGVLLVSAAGILRAGDYLWTGGGSGLWDVPANWSPTGVPVATSDTATFNNDASVRAPVAYTGAVVVASRVIFGGDNGATNVIAGPVSGAGALVVEGPGTVAFLGTNTAFTGPVGVTSGGTLFINDEVALGDAIAPLTIQPSGTLDFSGSTVGNAVNITKPVTVAGTVTYSGTPMQQNAFGGPVTLAPGATFAGTGRFDFRGASVDFANTVFTKTGPNSIQFAGNGTQILNPPSGTAFDVQAGELMLADSTTFGGTSDSAIALAPGARLALWVAANPIPYAVHAAAGSNIHVQNTDNANTNLNVFTGPVTLGGDVRVTGALNTQLTFAGPLSGPGGFTAASAETILASPASDYTGPTVVSNGVLRPLTPATLSAASALTVRDGGTLRLTAAASSADGWTDADIAAVLTSAVFTDPSATLGLDTTLRDLAYTAAPAAFTHGLAKYGTGTLDYLVPGAQNFGPLTVRGGTLNLAPGAALNLLPPAAAIVGPPNGSTAFLNLPAGASLTTADPGQGNANSQRFSVGASGRGVATLAAGASVTAGRVIVGDAGASVGVLRLAEGSALHSYSGSGNTGNIGLYGGSYGYIQNDGAVFTNNGEIAFGGESTSVGLYRQTAGLFAVAGGTVAPAGTPGGFYGGMTSIGRSGNAHAYFSGGTFVQHGNSQVHLGNLQGTAGGLSVLTLAGDAAFSADRIDSNGGNNNHQTLINLLGGTLNLNYVWQETRPGSTATVNFNGGTFRTRSSQSDFFRNGVQCVVYPGGGTIDTAGMNGQVGTPLAGPSGLGVAAIAVSSGGSGYLAPPLVTFTGGGGGSGAVAWAEVNSTGAVTAVTILNPGRAYTTRPVITFTGGGGTGAAATVTRIAPTAGGGFCKTGAGTLTLSGPSTYTGPTAVRGGTLSLGPTGTLPASPVTVGGGATPAVLDLALHSFAVPSVTLEGGGRISGGTLLTSAIVKDTPGATDLSAVFAAPSALTPGLYAWQVVDTTLTWEAAKLLPVPEDIIEPGATLANTPGDWGTTRFGLYAGYIWNRSPTNEVWSFAESIDDDVRFILDGETIIDNTNWQATTVATRTVTPGPHAIKLLVANIGNTGGPVNQDGWGTTAFGFGVDRLGRGLKDSACYERLLDPGDGSLLTVNTNAAPALAEVRQGTLRCIPDNRPGLYAAEFLDVDWSTTVPANPLTAVALGATLANSLGTPNANIIPGSPWRPRILGTYAGCIWNRSPTNEVWSFAESIDDTVSFSFDGALIINNGAWNATTVATLTVTPGPHAIELRVYNDNGGSGPVNQDGWGATDFGFGVDRLGRGQKSSTFYERLLDPGDGSLLTTGPVSSAPLQDIPVDIASGAALDLAGAAQRFGVITGTGAVTNGTLAAGNVLSPAGDTATGPLALSDITLGAVTYRVTLRGVAADLLAFAGPADLSALTVEPSDALSLAPGGANDYVIATAPAFPGALPALSGFPSKWKLLVRNGELHLTSIGGTLLLIK